MLETQDWTEDAASWLNVLEHQSDALESVEECFKILHV